MTTVLIAHEILYEDMWAGTEPLPPPPPKKPALAVGPNPSREHSGGCCCRPCVARRVAVRALSNEPCEANCDETLSDLLSPRCRTCEARLLVVSGRV